MNTAKKRATVTATVDSVVADTNTVCPTGSLEIDDSCSTCPAGWGLSGTTCAQCPLATYSAGNTITACTPCQGDATTVNKGSTDDEDCVNRLTVCTVAEASTAEATLVPPKDARVPLNTLISVSCGTGYALALGMDHTFKCGSKDPSCFR